MRTAFLNSLSRHSHIIKTTASVLWHLLGARPQTQGFIKRSISFNVYNIFHVTDEELSPRRLLPCPRPQSLERQAGAALRGESGVLMPGLPVDPLLSLHSPQETSLQERQAPVWVLLGIESCFLTWMVGRGVFLLLLLFKLYKYLFTHTHFIYQILHTHNLKTNRKD